MFLWYHDIYKLIIHTQLGIARQLYYTILLKAQASYSQNVRPSPVSPENQNMCIADLMSP